MRWVLHAPSFRQLLLALLRKKGKDSQIAAGLANSRDAELLTKRDNGEAVDVYKAIANEADVGKGTVQRYMQVSAHPELLAEVQAGSLKIGTAHRLLDAEIMKQLNHADKLYRYIEKRMHHITNEDTRHEIKSRLAEVVKQLEVLTA